MATLYSIVMPYYDRLEQLKKTLASYIRQYPERTDFEVVIVADYGKMSKSESDRRELLLTVQLFQQTSLNIRPVLWFAEEVINPVCMFNSGVIYANGERIVLTNPECRHLTNVLGGFDEEFEKHGENIYVVCACKATRKDGSFFKWFSHSEYNPTFYHFCSCLTKKKYMKMGGFGEEFVEGYCFDDDDFRDRLKKILIPRDDLIVEHQWHEKHRPVNWRELWERNRRLYEKRKKEREGLICN